MARSTAPDLEATVGLIALARQGDRDARERLARRYLPLLRVFARGRLPHGMRSLEETNDLVQVALIRGFARLDTFRAEHRGSFLVYLRTIVDNLIRDRWRSQARRPDMTELSEDLPDRGRSPFDDLVTREDRERYERALDRLRPGQREAVILRFELDCSYEDIAAELGIRGANAARMRVERALLRLAKILGTPRDGGDD